MIRARVIPCLLVTGEATLVKTVGFARAQYIGDPVNTVSIFNDLEVDEIAILDIEASRQDREPQFELIREITANCFIPLSYGGGVKTIDHMKRLFDVGVEKIILNTALFSDPDLVSGASEHFGAQAIVASIDVKQTLLGRRKVFRRLGQAVKHSRARSEQTNDLLRSLDFDDPADFARYVQALGVGEIFLNSVDRDGTFEGYDLDLIRAVVKASDVPVVACGGAKNFRDLRTPVLQAGASAVAAGSIFVYQNQNRSVLVSFPDRSELKEIFAP